MPLQFSLHKSLRLSVKGKKASEATTNPDFLFFFEVLYKAILVASILLICPAPIPSVCLFLHNTIAFDLTCLQTLKQKIKSSMVFFEALALAAFDKSCNLMIMLFF